MGAEKKYVLQGPAEIYLRALCIGLCSSRGRMEMTARSDPAAKDKRINLEQARKQLLQWIKASPAEKFLSRKEKDLIHRPLGGLKPQELIDISWREEALSILLWAIKYMDTISPYDRESDHETAYQTAVKFISESAEEKQVIRRPDEEILKQRDIAEGWHWRSRTQKIIKEKIQVPLPPGMTLEAIVEFSAAEHFKLGEIPEPIGKDFPAFGKPYKDLSEEEFTLITSITMERHYALNWICGYARDWDKVPTDT